MNIKINKILIVDDEPIIAKLLSAIAKNCNVQAESVENGYDAIKKVESSTYDLVFLDFIMPGLNGPETFKIFKKINPKLNVVMMTGYAMDHLLEEARSLGVREIMRKPFDISKIETLIRATVKLNRVGVY